MLAEEREAEKKLREAHKGCYEESDCLMCFLLEVIDEERRVQDDLRASLSDALDRASRRPPWDREMGQ